jgi:hypothetical protein
MYRRIEIVECIKCIFTTAAVQVVSESALQAREDETRQVAMGTQHTPDRPSVAVPEMRHTTTPTWRAPLKRAYDTHFKCPHYPPTHPFPRTPETPDRGTS